MGPGTFFGETALLFGVLRTTTVTTNAKCLMLAISKKNYDQLVPEVATLFEEEARRRCVGKLGKMSKTVPFLAEIDSDIFLERGEIITIDNDTRVFEKGSIGDCFYIILFGEVGVIGDAECEPIHAEDDGTAPHEPSPTTVHHYDPSLEEAFLTLRTGQYFGEMVRASQNRPR
jgi:CRP-like cAMP-binding protein